jgi:hypothetical protein
VRLKVGGFPSLLRGYLSYHHLSPKLGTCDQSAKRIPGF